MVVAEVDVNVDVNVELVVVMEAKNAKAVPKPALSSNFGHISFICLQHSATDAIIHSQLKRYCGLKYSSISKPLSELKSAVHIKDGYNSIE